MVHLIENIVVTEKDIGRKVIYVPNHANGDVSHPDSEMGTISSISESSVFVRFKGPTGTKCPVKNLKWDY